jgi:hypothetical protein
MTIIGPLLGLHERLLLPFACRLGRTRRKSMSIGRMGPSLGFESVVSRPVCDLDTCSDDCEFAKPALC